jgi:hypothetical protein
MVALLDWAIYLIEMQMFSFKESYKKDSFMEREPKSNCLQIALYMVGFLEGTFAVSMF